jgi:hypothetical protein
MADHIGSIGLAESVFTDPTTRVEILVDGQPIVAARWVRTHPGATYAYWQATVPEPASRQVEIVARIYLQGVHEVDRVVSVSFD